MNCDEGLVFLKKLLEWWANIITQFLFIYLFILTESTIMVEL